MPGNGQQQVDSDSRVPRELLLDQYYAAIQNLSLRQRLTGIAHRGQHQVHEVAFRECTLSLKSASSRSRRASIACHVVPITPASSASRSPTRTNSQPVSPYKLGGAVSERIDPRTDWLVIK